MQVSGEVESGQDMADEGGDRKRGATLAVGKGMTLSIGDREYRLKNISIPGQTPESMDLTAFGLIDVWGTLHMRDAAPLVDMGRDFRRFEKRRPDGSFRRGRR